MTPGRSRGNSVSFQKSYWERSELDERRSPDHPVVEAYVLPKIDLICRHVSLTGETRLLDVGCGNGYFSYHFDRICDTTAVDYSEKMLALNPVGSKALMDAANLGFEDGAFDVVFCHALLHHVDNMEKVIREMKRVSRKYVIILEPNRNNPLMFLFSLAVPEERKALLFSLAYLERNVARCGLGVNASYSSGMIVPNKVPVWLLPLLSRFNFRQPFGLTNFIIASRE